MKFNTLSQILSYFRKTKGNNTEITHTSMDFPKGSFSIPPEYLNQFLELYIKDLNKGKNLHLIERHCPNGPILIDFDFKLSDKFKNRTYTKDFLLKLTKLYQDTIKNLITLPEDDIYKLKCFVFEKTKPVYNDEKNFIKDGLHMMFPFLITDIKFQYLLRDNINKALNTEEIYNDVFSDFKSNKPLNSIEDINDDSIIAKNGWLMYGSKKSAESTTEAYKLTYIFNDTLTELNINYPNNDLVTILSIRKNCILTNYTINNQEEFDKYKINKKQTKPINTPKPKKQIRDQNDTLDRDRWDSIYEFNLKYIKKCVECLDISRAIEYSKWIELCWCLHTIHPIKLLDTFIEFSKKSPDYINEDDCKGYWDLAKDPENSTNVLGIGTLRYWARIDNKDQYANIKKEILKDIAINRIYNKRAQNHKDIASLIRIYYNGFFSNDDELKFVHISGDGWYHYNNSRWKLDSDGGSLKKAICDELTPLILKPILDSIYDECKNALPEDKDIVKKKLDSYDNVYNKFNQNSFLEQILKMCEMQFAYDRTEWYKKLDSNKYLIGFENGVYDIQNRQFRKNNSSDFVSKSTKLYYNDYNINDDNETKQEIELFIKQVLVNPKIRDYQMKRFASCLVGGNSDELFDILTGSGGNGKSKLIEIMILQFGEYYSSLNVSALTNKRGKSNEASPEFARLFGTRMVVAAEPEGTEELNVGLIKEITGRDTITARGLHKDLIEYKPDFSVFLTCNKLPKINSDDNGTWRRIRAIPYNSKFDDNPDPNDPLQFKKDSHIDQKFEVWVESGAFFQILLEYYTKYEGDIDNNGHIFQPDEVKQKTQSYKEDNDNENRFINEYIIYTAENTKLGIREAYSVYKTWYVENTNEKTKRASQIDFKDKLTNEYPRLIQEGCGEKRQFKSIFKNLRLLTDEERDKRNEELNAQKITNESINNEFVNIEIPPQ